VTSQLTFIHRFVPGSRPGAVPLLLLHGTGGNETDLLDLGRSLAPGSPLLSPRGRVLENGMPRFFRRLAEGVFDVADVRLQAGKLAEFISQARAQYALGEIPPLALGYSNGANIAAALLLLHPEILSGAVLLRPMVPLIPDSLPDLSAVRVLIAAGLRDPIAVPAQAQALGELLSRCGAELTLQWSNAAHGLVQDDLDAAERWLAVSSTVE
jgi:phospholipase/carboxylesterase